MTTPNEHTFHTPHHDEGCTKCGGFPSDPCEPPIPMRANEHEWMIEEIINEIEYLYCAHELPQQVLDANRKHFTTLTAKVREEYLREDIERLEGMKVGRGVNMLDEKDMYKLGQTDGYNNALDTLIHQKQEELSALSKEA